MSFNLIHDAWLPIRRRSGKTDWIKPASLTAHLDSDPATALHFPRPDWNAAVTEFLIGLFACALAPENAKVWVALWKNPPDPKMVADKLDELAFAFDLDSPGPSAFQDFDSLEGDEDRPAAQLFLDAPGAITIAKNTDLFQKRGRVESLCLPYAAAALISMQTYAPSGGVGYRTSLRGGGPLTTLVVPSSADSDPGTPCTLWAKIWANVPDVPKQFAPNPKAKPGHPSWSAIFPWLSPLAADERKRTVGPDDVNHVLLPFFAVPRRVRLVAENIKASCCSFGGPTNGRAVKAFRARNYGWNYLGFVHPLSPYRTDKKSGQKFPLHASSSQTFYRDWPTIWGAREGFIPARCLSTWSETRATLAAGAKRALRPTIEAMGFDTDNAKIVAWVENRPPLFAVSSRKKQDALYATFDQLVQAANLAAGALRFSIRIAQFASKTPDGYRLPENGNFGDAGAAQVERFWRLTELDFRKALAASLSGAEAETSTLRNAWLGRLRRAALSIFDSDIAQDSVWSNNPERFVTARSNLYCAFLPAGRIAKAMRIEPADDEERPATKKTRRKHAPNQR